MTENWQPYMPLEADASDKQMGNRVSYLAIGWNANQPLSAVVMAREFSAATALAHLGSLTTADAFARFVAGVLIAVTDGETDDIGKFPYSTNDRLTALYDDMVYRRGLFAPGVPRGD